MTLQAPNSVIKAGNPVPVDIAVKNISKHEVTWADWRGRHDSAPGPDNEFGTGIVVSDAAGNPVPLTKAGRVLLNEEYFLDKADLHAPENDLPKGGFAFLRVAPGQIQEERKLVGELYDLRNPGTYTIQASLIDPVSHLRVKSNPVVVTVTESHSPGAATGPANPRAIPQGVSLAISRPGRSVKAGSQVWLKVSLSNHSRESIGVPGDDSEFCYPIDAYDEKGVAVPPTEIGRQCMRDMLTVKVTSDSAPLINISPGGTWTGKVDVSRLIDMRRPGTYMIQIHYGRLLSNRIKVIVTA
jgi:hypothetical protein